MYIPTVFSPNRDGINDYFFVQGDASLISQVHTFSIYNRYGSPVFQNRNSMLNDPDSGWSGLVQGKQSPQGVYVYVAEIVFLDGRVERKKGEVVLVR